MMPSHNHLCNDVGFGGRQLANSRKSSRRDSAWSSCGGWGDIKRRWHLPTFNDGERNLPRPFNKYL